jgi:hypothetical protein
MTDKCTHPKRRVGDSEYCEACDAFWLQPEPGPPRTAAELEADKEKIWNTVGGLRMGKPLPCQWCVAPFKHTVDVTAIHPDGEYHSWECGSYFGGEGGTSQMMRTQECWKREQANKA